MTEDQQTENEENDIDLDALIKRDRRNNKKSIYVAARLTPKEKEKLVALTESLEVTESELIRFLIRYAEIVTVSEDEEGNKVNEIVIHGLTPTEQT